MTTRILITGGCGFVGANLISHLTEVGGYDISVLDNESLGEYKTIEPFGVTFIKGDLRDKDAVATAVNNQDAVVHLAADTRVMDSIKNPEFNFEVNVVGTFNLLTAARAAGVRRIVNASTGGAILGEVPPPVNELMAPNPSSPYGASKLAVEGYCSAFGESYGLPTISLRFSNVYGPLSVHKGSVVAAFFRQILKGETLVVYGDGSQQRDYVYSQDLAAGIRLAIDSQHTGPFQLGTGVPTSVNELIDHMRAVVGDEYPVKVEYKDFRAGEILHTYCDISKARATLGFDPSTSVPDGLASTWKWFLDQR